MRRTRARGLLCRALGPPGAVAAGERAELLRLEHVWNDAHVRGDARAFSARWADGLTIIVPRMAPLRERDALSFANSGQMVAYRYETCDVQISADTNIATVIRGLVRTRILSKLRCAKTTDGSSRSTRGTTDPGRSWRSR